METRYCRKCGMTKELSLFYKTREYKGKSYYSCCKECWDKRTKENRKTHLAADQNQIIAEFEGSTTIVSLEDQKSFAEWLTSNVAAPETSTEED